MLRERPISIIFSENFRRDFMMTVPAARFGSGTVLVGFQSPPASKTDLTACDPKSTSGRTPSARRLPTNERKRSKAASFFGSKATTAASPQ